MKQRVGRSQLRVLYMLGQQMNRMGNYIRRHKALAAAIALGILFALSPPIRGEFAARIDVHRGHYRLLGYGMSAAWLPEYARCLKERYGIEFHGVAECAVSESLVSYVDAYDLISRAAVRRKFGHDVITECEKYARDDYYKKSQTEQKATARQ